MTDHDRGRCGYGSLNNAGQCPHPATTHLMVTTPTHILGIGSCTNHLTNVRGGIRICDRHPFRRTCAVPDHAWHNSGHATSWCGPAWSGP